MADHWREVIKVLDATWAQVQSLAKDGVPHQTICVLWERYQDMRNTIISYYAQQSDQGLADPTAKMTAEAIRQLVQSDTPPDQTNVDSKTQDGLSRFEATHPHLVAAARERMSLANNALHVQPNKETAE